MKHAPISSAEEAFTVPVSGRVYAVEVAEFAWCSDLVLFGTATSVGVVRITLPEDSGSGGLEHELLHEFHHDCRVRCLAWSCETNLSEVPRTIQFASAGADHLIRLFRHTGKGDGARLEVHPLRGHTDYIGDICFTPDGQTLASVGDDLTVRLWDAGDRTPLACIPTETPYVSVRWHPEEPYKLMAASSSGTVTFFNTQTLSAVCALHTGVPALAAADWCPMDSLRVATLHEGQLITMDVSQLSKRDTVHELYSGGGQLVRFSRTARQHVATCSLHQVKVTQIGLQQAPLTVDLTVVGGLSWHSVLPYLVVGADRKLLLWRVTII